MSRVHQPTAALARKLLRQEIEKDGPATVRDLVHATRIKSAIVMDAVRQLEASQDLYVWGVVTDHYGASKVFDVPRNEPTPRVSLNPKA